MKVVDDVVIEVVELLVDDVLVEVELEELVLEEPLQWVRTKGHGAKDKMQQQLGTLGAMAQKGRP